MRSLLGASIERQEGRLQTCCLLVLRNVVVQLGGLLVELGRNVLALGLLSRKFQNGGLELENLVLDLAALLPSQLPLFNSELRINYLEGVGRLAICSINGGIESIILGIVGDTVDRVEEVEICLVHGGQVRRQASEPGESLLLGVSGNTAADGDLVVRGSAEHCSLGHGTSRSQHGESDGEESGLHLDGKDVE